MKRGTYERHCGNCAAYAATTKVGEGRAVILWLILAGCAVAIGIEWWAERRD